MGGDKAEPSIADESADGKELDESDDDEKHPCTAFIDRLVTCCLVLRMATSAPMLILYAIASLAFMGYFLYLHYEIVLALTCTSYLAIVSVYYSFSLQFKDLKKFLKKMMHKVLVDLPKTIVYELTEKTKDNLADAHEMATHHLGRAVDHVSDKLDQVQALLDSCGDNVHEEVSTHVNNLKENVAAALRIHKQKSGLPPQTALPTQSESVA